MKKYIIICDVCSKEENLWDNPYRKKWFIENISHDICSVECFEKFEKQKEEPDEQKS